MASLHLPLPETERLDHVTRALAVLRASGVAPALAGGDLNERPGRTAWSFLETQGMRDLGPDSGPTFPAVRPEKRIDGVFATDDVELVDYRVVHATRVEPDTDHRPLLVALRLPEG